MPQLRADTRRDSLLDSRYMVQQVVICTHHSLQSKAEPLLPGACGMHTLHADWLAFLLTLPALTMRACAAPLQGKAINGRGFCPGSGCPVAIGAKPGNISQSVKVCICRWFVPRSLHCVNCSLRSGTMVGVSSCPCDP